MGKIATAQFVLIMVLLIILGITLEKERNKPPTVVYEHYETMESRDLLDHDIIPVDFKIKVDYILFEFPGTVNAKLYSNGDIVIITIFYRVVFAGGTYGFFQVVH